MSEKCTIRSQAFQLQLQLDRVALSLDGRQFADRRNGIALFAACMPPWYGRRRVRTWPWHRPRYSCLVRLLHRRPRRALKPRCRRRCSGIVLRAREYPQWLLGGAHYRKKSHIVWQIVRRAHIVWQIVWRAHIVCSNSLKSTYCLLKQFEEQL